MLFRSVDSSPTVYYSGAHMSCSPTNRRVRDRSQIRTTRSVFRVLDTDRSFMLGLKVMIRNYKEVPWYWYLGLLILAFFAGMCTPDEACRA